MTTAIISIYHKNHKAFHPYQDGDPLEIAYYYDTDRVDMEEIYEDNQAGVGVARNTLASKRSLSIGDVVIIGFSKQPATIFAVADIGMKIIAEGALERSLRTACSGCMVCDAAN